MSDDNTVETVTVDVTDDLDAFSDEFFGSSEPAKVEEKEEVQADEADAVEETDAEVEEKEVEDEADDASVDDDDEEEEDEDVDPEPQPKKNRKSAKERISELTAKVRDAEARERAARAEFEARLAKIEEKNKEPEPKAAEKKDDGRPDPEAVDANGELVYPLGKFDPDFAADTVRWTMKVEREAERAAEAARIEEETKLAAEGELVSQWNVKLETTEKDVPDLRERIAVLEDNFTGIDETHGRFLVETIMTLDRGPEVLLYLADNISEAEKIVASSPRAATIALGRIEGQLQAKNVKATPKVSNAPKPPATTRGNHAAKRVSPDTDDLEAFEREFFKK